MTDMIALIIGGARRLGVHIAEALVKNRDRETIRTDTFSVLSAHYISI